MTLVNGMLNLFACIYIVFLFCCLGACFSLLCCAAVAHSPYGRAAYANVNGLDPGSTAGPGSGSGYRSHQDEQDDQQMQYQQQQQQDFGMSPAGHSPTRRLAPPPPSRSGGVEGTYQPRPPPPVPAEAMASLNIGLDKSGRLNSFPFPPILPVCCFLSTFFFHSFLFVVDTRDRVPVSFKRDRVCGRAHTHTLCGVCLHGIHLSRSDAARQLFGISERNSSSVARMDFLFFFSLDE